MKIVSGQSILDFVKNHINLEKQLHSESINLTIKSIYEIQSKGRIDFGGSEFVIGNRKEITPVKEKPDDKLGWWDLPHGDYLIVFNEKVHLIKGYIGILQPLERLIVNGTTHESVMITSNVDKVEANLRVGRSGLMIKQNARISNLIIFKVDQI